MTLPSYIESLQYYTEGKKFYKCPLFFGFQCRNNQIRPAIVENSLTYEFYKPLYYDTDLSFYHILYIFPNIPNESDYNKFLKDFLYKLKLDRINDDFS